MENINAVAARLFNRHGLSFDGAEPAEAWTNCVWINGDVVLRLAGEKDTDRMRREASLAKLLPPETNYPELLDIGTEDGREWSIARRIPAEPLRTAWGGLTWEEKMRALIETLRITRAVHDTVSPGAAKEFVQTKSWFSSFDKDESMASLEKYSAQKFFNGKQCGVLRGILENFYARLQKENPVLCHGDITEDNLLYDGGHIVSLLDFEYAIIAPAMLDIHAIVNLAFLTADGGLSVDAAPVSYTRGVTELLAPWLTKPGADELLLGYAVLFQQRILSCWLKHPERKPEDSGAWQKLAALASGGGHLSKLLHRG